MKPFHLMRMILSTSILFYHVIHLVSLWPDIPSEIGIHYSDGQPDQLGSKSFLLVMPMISLLFWILMQMVVRRPEKLNYVDVTEKNKQVQYRKAEKVMILIQSLGSIAFLVGNEAFLRRSVGMETSLPFTIAIGLLAICFLAPLYLLFWAATLKD